MKKREFNKHLNACRNKAKTALDMVKLQTLPFETRREMGLFVVRSRGPLLAQLANTLDRPWLESMGYLYRTASAGNPECVFVHTAAHKIV